MKTKNNPTILGFLGEKITYDSMGQYLWAVDKEGGHQKLADLRGWGAIQNLFKNNDGTIDMEKAAQFQDELGKWVSEAINEKKNGSTQPQPNSPELDELMAKILVQNWVLKTTQLEEQVNLILTRDYNREVVRRIVRSMKEVYNLFHAYNLATESLKQSDYIINKPLEKDAANLPEEPIEDLQLELNKIDSRIDQVYVKIKEFENGADFPKKEAILSILDGYKDILRRDKKQLEDLKLQKKRELEVPNYREILGKQAGGEKLTAVEFFLLAYEPKEDSQSELFRNRLIDILNEAYGKNQ